jgi:glycosyltransferase involved in cell wall biosynthesis
LIEYVRSVTEPMTTPYRLSIIIPCFNHGEFLPEVVASVKGAARKDLELIVVDDGSTDARTSIEMDALTDQGVHVIRQENKGLAAARNAAILASKGEYIFPLDADDHLCPGWIDRGIQILDSKPQIGVVYGDALCFGTRNDRWRVGPFDPDLLLDWNFIHASALYRRRIWEQNCGYDGTMPVQGFEDWDFWLGALAAGWQFYYLPEVFFEYRQAEHSMLTRASGFEGRVEEFIAKKHGLLYRRRWQALSPHPLRSVRTPVVYDFDMAIVERSKGNRSAATKHLVASLRRGLPLAGRSRALGALLLYCLFGIKRSGSTVSSTSK